MFRKEWHIFIRFYKIYSFVLYYTKIRKQRALNFWTKWSASSFFCGWGCFQILILIKGRLNCLVVCELVIGTVVLVKWKLSTPNISEAGICKQEWHHFGWYLKKMARGIFQVNSTNLVKVCWVPSQAIFKRACRTYLLKRKQEKEPNSNDLTSILFVCQLQSF